MAKAVVHDDNQPCIVAYPPPPSVLPRLTDICVEIGTNVSLKRTNKGLETEHSTRDLVLYKVDLGLVPGTTSGPKCPPPPKKGGRKEKVCDR